MTHFCVVHVGSPPWSLLLFLLFLPCSNAVSTCGLLSVTKPVISVSKGSGTYEMACSSIDAKMISARTKVAGERDKGEERRRLQEELGSSLETEFSRKVVDYSQFTRTAELATSPSTVVNSSSSLHLKRLEDLRSGCYDICDTSLQGRKARFFPEITKRVNCPALMANHHIDASRPLGPAPEIPLEMMPAFTYGGLVPIVPHTEKGYNGKLFNQHYSERAAQMPVWKKTLVEFWKTQCEKNNLWGSYGQSDTNNVYKALKLMKSVTGGGHLLVIGSENPWLESCALAAGAKKVTTLGSWAFISLHFKPAGKLFPNLARHRL